jgi:hypothetical protein
MSTPTGPSQAPHRLLGAAPGYTVEHQHYHESLRHQARNAYALASTDKALSLAELMIIRAFLEHETGKPKRELVMVSSHKDNFLIFGLRLNLGHFRKYSLH